MVKEKPIATVIKCFKVTLYIDELTVVGYSATPDIYKEGDKFITVMTDPGGIESYSIRVDLVQSFAVTPVADEIHGVGDMGDLSLRRCGCHKFSAGNYAGRPVNQLRQLLKEVTDKYMANRDFKWYCEQSGLIDEAAQVAYKQGRY